MIVAMSPPGLTAAFARESERPPRHNRAEPADRGATEQQQDGVVARRKWQFAQDNRRGARAAARRVDTTDENTLRSTIIPFSDTKTVFEPYPADRPAANSGRGSRRGACKTNCAPRTLVAYVATIWVLAASLAVHPAAAQVASPVTNVETASRCDGATEQGDGDRTAACIRNIPIFRIDPGTHVARITEAAIDRKCQFLVTGSVDRTVRLWEVPSGKLLRTIRLPTDDGAGGQIYALALSADGQWIVAAGSATIIGGKSVATVFALRIDGTDFRRLATFEDANVTALALPRTGLDRVAIGLSPGGIRVIDFSTRTEIWSKRADDDLVQSLVFGRSGQLYASSLSGVAKFDEGGRLLARSTATKNDIPGPLSLSQNEEFLMLGYTASMHPFFSVLHTKDLKVALHSKTNDKELGQFSAVVWSPNGDYMLASGQALASFSKGFVTRLFDLKQSRITEIAALNRATTAVASCGPSIAFTFEPPSIGFRLGGGPIRLAVDSATVDMSTALFYLSTTADGATVTLGGRPNNDGSAEPRYEVNLTKGVITESRYAKDMAVAKTEVGDLVAAQTGKPIGGIVLPNFLGETPMAVRRVGTSIILGTRTDLRKISQDGKVDWRTATPSGIAGAEATPDRRLIVAALDDGTIRWYRWSDGKELLALFVHKLDRRWVAWTPTGYYMASAGGEDLIGWHVNRGWEQAPDFFPASRFRDRFARPDIVQKILKTLDEDKAVAEANAEANRKTDIRPIEAQLPPVIAISRPRDNTTFSGTEVMLDYTLRAPSGLKVDAIEVLIDGRPASGVRGVERADLAPEVAACLDNASRGVERVDDKQCRLTIPVPARSVEIGLIARSGTLASSPALVRMTYAGAGTGGGTIKPKLYVLAVGVADYVDPDLKLGLAGKDALDFVKAMAAQQGKHYSAVDVRVLVDRTATRVAMLDGLDWLERQVKPGDVAMVFMAGHGTADERGLFWFLPADVARTSLRATAVSQDDLRRTLSALPGKAILFLDACHAGQAATVAAKGRGAIDLNLLVNDLSAAENGIVTFASARGRELSQENAAWGNGAFTRALIDGLSGEADFMKRGEVTLTGLDYFISTRVKDLTGDTQHPVMTKPSTIADYAVVGVH